MSPKMGLVRVTCSSCQEDQFLILAELMASEAVACRTCSAPHHLEALMEKDEQLARLVAILRQLESFRAHKVAREERRISDTTRRLREMAVVSPAQDG